MNTSFNTIKVDKEEDGVTWVTFNRPNYPPGQWLHRAELLHDEEEFYQVENLPAHLGELEVALLAWDHVHETVRHHQALDCVHLP